MKAKLTGAGVFRRGLFPERARAYWTQEGDLVVDDDQTALLKVSFHEQWADLSIEEKRAILAFVLDAELY